MTQTESRQGRGGEVHPVIDLIQQRTMTDSQRGNRDDGRRLALAIEGGGAAGAISAGMCIGMEDNGLIGAVDVIYGTSSGALNGSYTAAGQAKLGSENYKDSASPQFYNPWRLLLGRQPVNFDFLFDEVIGRRRPYDETGLKEGPEFRAVGVKLESQQVEVMQDFRDVEELTQAVRASCALPVLSGAPIAYRGAEMADGGLLESMPYQTALNQGATDVLVLRSKSALYRKNPYPKMLIETLRRVAHPSMPALVEARPELYNVAAEDLAQRSASEGSVFQITPDHRAVSVSQLERSPKTIRLGIAYGELALSRAIPLLAA